MDRTKGNRVLYLDAARFFAILLAALNHAVNRTWDNFNGVQEEFYRISTASTVLKAVISVTSRFGVPLFLMITGVLILNRRFATKEEFGRFFKHNWLPLLGATELWFFLGFWFLVFVNPYNRLLENAGWGGTLWALLKTLLFVDQVRFDSMWYLPMILSIYLLLPILAVFLYRSPAAKVILFPLAGVFLCDMLIPELNAFLPLFGGREITFFLYDMNFLSPYLIYVFAGWWIGNGGLRKLPDAAVVSGALLSCLLCCTLQLFLYSVSDHLLSYMSPGILVCAVFLFECLRRFADRPGKLSRPMSTVSRAAFALYVLHVFFVSALNWYGDFGQWPHPLRLCFLWLVPLAASALIIAALSKIPFCRKLLFLIK